jgi:hypothetical protein
VLALCGRGWGGASERRDCAVKKRETLLVTLVYIALTLFMTYPVVVRLGSHYIGSGSDMWIFHWNDWWLRKCLLEWRNPFHTTWMFYPSGVSLVYHNFAWLNTLMWLPISPLVGPIAAYNIIFILNLALGGVSMYALARYLVRDPRAAFVAGLVFAFWPFRLQHFNRPNLISTGWIPFFFLFLIRTVREDRKWRAGLLAGLFLGLTGLSRWLHLALTGVLAIIYVVYSLVCERHEWDGRTLGAMVLTVLVALLMVAPFGVPMVVAQIQGAGEAKDLYVERAEKGTDLIGYFVPERGHPVFQRWLTRLWAQMGQESFFGYAALLLVIYGISHARRRAAFWGLIAAGLFVFSLGAVLRVGGQIYRLPMPYSLIQSSLFAGLIREPRRLSMLLGLPMAALVAYGVEGLVGLVRKRWGSRFVWVGTVLLSGLLLFEYLHFPYPTVQPAVSPFYLELAREPDHFGLLELPMGATTPAKFYMYYSTIHGKPLVEGHVSRTPEDAYHFIDSLPLTYHLHQCNEIPEELGDISRQLRALADSNVRYLILHPSLAKAGQVAGWREWLFVEPTYEDQQIIVYNTSLRYGRDFQLANEIGDGVGVAEAFFSTDTLSQHDLLGVTVTWGAYKAPERNWTAYLALVDPSGLEAQRSDFEPCQGWPTSEWGQDAVARGRSMLQVDPFIKGGTYKVVVGLVDSISGTEVGEPLIVGQVEVRSVERTFQIPKMEVANGATFGTDLRLLGYDLQQIGETTVVTLHWQALRRMDLSYKFFIHLYDIESGDIIAQADVIPRDWTYPTTWWEAGEVVSDEIQLASVVPGQYQLAVGVYDPKTGERLCVQDYGDLVVVSDSLILQKVTVP